MYLTDIRWWFGMKPKFVSEPAKKYSVAVLIPAYNEKNFIKNTIESIKQQTVPIEQILVVDDCSTDNTGNIARKNGAEVIRTPRNQGSKAMAQNYALSRMNADIFVTVDADTILAPDAIERLLPYFNNYDTAAVCGFVIPKLITTIWERGRFVEYVTYSSVWKGGQNHIGAIIVLSGCFTAFRTDAIKRAGGFSPSTIAEDMDLTWRLVDAGYKTYFESTALCYPIDPPTGAVFIRQIDRWYRGFLQNVAQHRFIKKKKIGILVSIYLLDALLSPIWFVFFWVLSGKLIFGIMYMLIMELGVITLGGMPKAIRLGMLAKFLTSIPSFLVIRTVNMFIFWRSIWREWIVGDRLTIWQKGH